MSITMVLVPVSLSGGLFTGLLTSLVASTVLTIEKNAELDRQIAADNASFDFTNAITNEGMFAANAMHKNYSPQYQTICSEYKTLFSDEGLLMKTLKEHGVQNIAVENDKIYCTLDTLSFEFQKGDDGIYEMYITHKENEELDVVDELKDEYQLNAQEQSYMNIKNNLEKQNLSIESEEILEDNSIMITVNL